MWNQPKYEHLSQCQKAYKLREVLQDVQQKNIYFSLNINNQIPITINY
jgi:hypothetical protein